VVCIGGENENGLSKSVFIINYNEKNQSTSIVELADLPYPIANAAATLVANIVYLAGGETASGTSNSFMSLDLSNKSNTWKILPSLPQPTSHTVLLSKGKRIFLAGGRSKDERGISDIYNTLYEYDTKWKLKCALPYALSAGTGLVINPNSLVLFGGDKGETFHKVELLLAAIKDEKDASKKQELIEEKTRTQSSHPGFSKEVLVYNINTNKWGTINSIPFDVPVTTLALQYQNEIIIPSGEIRAGVRTPNILMGKINIMKK
jgi:N-acetylneuraminic acid mutarotase